MKGFFGVVAVGAMLVNWLIVTAFVFAEFGGWGILALSLTPLITGALGPPALWLVYGVPVIALWVWGVMGGAWLIWLVVPERDKLEGRLTVTSPVLGDLRRTYDDVQLQPPVTRLAKISGDAEDTEEAIERLRAESRENNQDPETWFELSQRHRERGDRRRSYDTAQVAVGLNPSEGRYHFAVSTILMPACVNTMFEGATDTGGTLEDLGLDLARARFKAEHHTKEAIRLGLNLATENQAKENLKVLRNLEKLLRRRRR